MSDLPSYEIKQLISMTGQKNFYLRIGRPKSQESKCNTLSTRIIKSDMVMNQPINQLEKKAIREKGCICGF